MALLVLCLYRRLLRRRVVVVVVRRLEPASRRCVDGHAGPSAHLLELLLERERGQLTVAFRHPQLFAYQTPEVGYHWYHRGTSVQTAPGAPR